MGRGGTLGRAAAVPWRSGARLRAAAIRWGGKAGSGAIPWRGRRPRAGRQAWHPAAS
ncbi:hypothetical protein HMPREF0731_1196, partial [Pseudoroseomonas cervicalis ATCC 49957]